MSLEITSAVSPKLFVIGSIIIDNLSLSNTPIQGKSNDEENPTFSSTSLDSWVSLSLQEDESYKKHGNWSIFKWLTMNQIVFLF